MTFKFFCLLLSLVATGMSFSIHTVQADGVDVFYRAAGPMDAPVILLLHGFPSSSFQYRNLIPLLASKYRVLAPDLPGFGFTVVPDARAYNYTFAALADTTAAFVDALSVSKFAMYIFDYGAPVGLRLALQRPHAVTAIVDQSGNAYVEGLGAFWDPIKAYWADPSEANRDALRPLLTFNTTESQYTTGAPDPGTLAPETWNLDAALLARAGNADIQLNLFLDYATNVALYPAFQAYFRAQKPPLLAVWGKTDPIFLPVGAQAFSRDLPAAQITLIDAGHFALESDLDTIYNEMSKFLARNHV